MFLGGLASGTQVSAGGFQENFGSAVGAVVSLGSQEDVESGGVGIGVFVVSGGTEQVFAGGTASATTVSLGGSQQVLLSSGFQYVLSDAVASLTSVGRGSVQDVQEGGLAISTTVALAAGTPQSAAQDRSQPAGEKLRALRPAGFSGVSR